MAVHKQIESQIRGAIRAPIGNPGLNRMSVLITSKRDFSIAFFLTVENARAVPRA
jgi:hypothetical protein